MANRDFFGVQSLNLEEKTICGSFEPNGTGVQASLSIGTSTSEVTYTAVGYGTGGNAIQVAHVQGAGALSVTVTGENIVVNLAAAGSTANAVAAAVNANPAAALLVTAVGGGTGTAVTAALAPLASGALGTPLNVSGLGFTVAYTGTGTYVVTLEDQYMRALSLDADLALGTPTKQTAQVGPANVTGQGSNPKQVTITTIDTSSGSAVDISAGTGNLISFCFELQNTDAPPT